MFSFSFCLFCFLQQRRRARFIELLSNIGMISLKDVDGVVPKEFVPVLFNGVFIGYVSPSIAGRFVKTLRKWKIRGEKDVPQVSRLFFFPFRVCV